MLTQTGMSDTQTTLSEYRSEIPTDTVTTVRTVKCKLQTSNRKNNLLQTAVSEWQNVAVAMADYLPSFPAHRWQQRDTQMTRLAKREFPDLDIYAHDRNVAVNKVREAFASWHSNNRAGLHPRGKFGDDDYIRICSCCDHRITIEENDQGYGVQLKLLKSTDPIWFHVEGGPYQYEYLAGVVDGTYSLGGAEVHLEGDDAFLHLPLTREVEVYEPEKVPRFVGVDIGETILYTMAAVEPDEDGDEMEVLEVDMESGREFRHHRERLKSQRDKLQRKGDLRGVREVKGEHERYTEHVLDTASRRIVEFAQDHSPSAIVLEDLTHYRETANDPIHDFPSALFREKIGYKATGKGIPVETIDPAGTSTTCRKCGQRDSVARDGTDFSCRRCGYEVHADVNAAINIGRAPRSGSFGR